MKTSPSYGDIAFLMLFGMLFMSSGLLKPELGELAISRRAMLSILPGVVAGPSVAGPSVAANASPDWESAMARYVAGRRAHEAFVKGVLDPAYHAASPGVKGAVGLHKSIAGLREKVCSAERALRQSGATRDEVLAYRERYSGHRSARAELADHIREQRHRRRLIRQHCIFALEEEGDELLAARHDALIALLNIPVADPETLRDKLSLAYEEVLQYQDDRGLILSLVADVQRVLASLGYR